MDAGDELMQCQTTSLSANGPAATDRLRVAIESHQKATERQNSHDALAERGHDSSDDLDGSPHRRPGLARGPLLAFLVAVRSSNVALT
jgi:hypothetical protein